MAQRSSSSRHEGPADHRRALPISLGLWLLGACSIGEAAGPTPRAEDAPRPSSAVRSGNDGRSDGPPGTSPAGTETAAQPAPTTPEAAPQDSDVPTPEGFFDLPDAPALERLRSGAIAAVKLGRGGRSVAFKLTLDNGTVGYFKPRQSFSAAKWYSEIAAFHLDRTLGLGRVPPVVKRVFHRDQLRKALGRDRRRAEVQWARDGTVPGALIWWIPGRLKPLPYALNWERWIRVRHWPSASVTPFQRPRVWADQKKLAREQGNRWRSAANRLKRRRARPNPDRPGRPQELSDMIVFDYLTRNIDRWGGNNANVLVRGRDGPLVFLDNAAGFASGAARPTLLDSRLRVLQRFNRSTIEAVRALDVGAYGARVNASSDGGLVLWPYHLRGLAERREALLAWVAECERRYGEDVYSWP